MTFPRRSRLLLFALAAVAIGSWAWTAPADQLIVGYGLLVFAAVIAVVLMARHAPRGQAGPGGWGDGGPDGSKPLGDGPDALDVELWLMIAREQSAAREIV